MSNIKIDGAIPNCPLCEQKMKRIVHKGRPVIACFRCMVNCYEDDPVCGNWNNAKYEDIPCPVHPNTAMKRFFRSDGWFKASCPVKGCGCSIDSGD